MKCFNCGRIGHFSKIFPHPKQEDSDDKKPCTHKYQKNKFIYKKKFHKNKKNIYSKEDSEDDDISEDVEVLFMGFGSENSGEEIEYVKDHEEELINAHEELEKYKNMYKKKNSHDHEFEEKKNMPK